MGADHPLRNRIKVERARHDLTQEQLADLVGVTRKTINTVETGKFVPSTVLASAQPSLRFALSSPPSLSDLSPEQPAPREMTSAVEMT